MRAQFSVTDLGLPSYLDNSTISCLQALLTTIDTRKRRNPRKSNCNSICNSRLWSKCQNKHFSQNVKNSDFSQNVKNSDFSQNVKISNYGQNVKISNYGQNVKIPNYADFDLMRSLSLILTR